MKIRQNRYKEGTYHKQQQQQQTKQKIAVEIYGCSALSKFNSFNCHSTVQMQHSTMVKWERRYQRTTNKTNLSKMSINSLEPSSLRRTKSMPHIVSSKQDLGYASSGTGSCSILDQIGTHPNFIQNEKVCIDTQLIPWSVLAERLNLCDCSRFPITHDWWPIWGNWWPCDNITIPKADGDGSLWLWHLLCSVYRMDCICRWGYLSSKWSKSFMRNTFTQVSIHHNQRPGYPRKSHDEFNLFRQEF